jgi:hypothetical protein
MNIELSTNLVYQLKENPMEDTFLKVAALDEAAVSEIRALEAATGKHIMAFEPGLQVAELDQAQARQVKALEEALGVTLLVFEA